MKFILPLFIFIAISAGVSAQSKNNISFVYGLSNTNVNIHGAIGDYGYDSKTGMLFGLSYTRNINRIFAIETGLLIADDKVQLNTIGGYGVFYYNGDVKAITVPVYAKITFLRYFYANGGIAIDKQTNSSGNTTINDQSGIGLGLGVGAKYSFGPVSVFVNPYFRQFGVIRFSGDGQNNSLFESGLKFGLGYNF